MLQIFHENLEDLGSQTYEGAHPSAGSSWHDVLVLDHEIESWPAGYRWPRPGLWAVGAKPKTTRWGNYSAPRAWESCSNQTLPPRQMIHDAHVIHSW